MADRSEYFKQYNQKRKAKNKKRVFAKYHTEEGQKYEYKRRRYVTARFGLGKRSAAKRGKEWSITLEQYREIIKNPCKYCNLSIADETGSGLDRIDNEQGYHVDNVNPCCARCNRRRHKTMSAAEFKRQSKLNRE